MALATAPNHSPLEVVFSFDTTGSMYGCLEQVRGRLQDMIQRLQSDIPGIRMAVFAHGDYCDTSTYVTKWVDFTTDVAELCNFVQTVARTGGGDSPECYELVLHQTRTKLSWTPFSTRRALVLIGDDEPHEPSYPENKDKIDWRKETAELAKQGVKIYGVQCGNNTRADNFYQAISTTTGGKHIRLDDFGSMFDVLMAVCYREGHHDFSMLASYEKEVKARGGEAGAGADISAIFASLLGDDVADSTSTPMDTTSGTTKPTKTGGTAKKTSAVKTKKTPASLKSRTSPKNIKTHRPKNVKARTFHKKKLPLLKRENVLEKNFGLNSLKWSPWIIVLTSKKPEDQPECWVKRRGLIGYRLNMVKSSARMTNSQRKVLFEVSVQTPSRGKLRHVVCNSFSTRLLNNARWERCLLSVRHQLEHVLGMGCHVYLRYSVLGARTDVSNVRCDLSRYDYAWRKLRHVRDHGRSVQKGSYVISRDDH